MLGQTGCDVGKVGEIVVVGEIIELGLSGKDGELARLATLTRFVSMA